MVGVQPLGELMGTAFVERGAVRCRESVGAAVAEVRLGCMQVVPVGLRLRAEPFDGGELAVDAEQLLDDAL
jgi:hypothetical protein